MYRHEYYHHVHSTSQQPINSFFTLVNVTILWSTKSWVSGYRSDNNHQCLTVCADDFVSIIHLPLDNIYAAITQYIKSESNEDSRNSVRIWFLLATKEALFATVKCIRCFQRWLAASNKHQLLVNIFIISDWAVSTRTRDSWIICVSVKLPICLKGVRHLISTSKSNSCSCGRGDVTSRQANTDTNTANSYFLLLTLGM